MRAPARLVNLPHSAPLPFCRVYWLCVHVHTYMYTRACNASKLRIHNAKASARPTAAEHWPAFGNTELCVYVYGCSSDRSPRAHPRAWRLFSTSAGYELYPQPPPPRTQLSAIISLRVAREIPCFVFSIFTGVLANQAFMLALCLEFITKKEKLY